MTTITCVDSADQSVYDELFDFFGLDNYIGTQYLLWFIILLPMLLISVCLSCILGKLSDKFCCVPFVNGNDAKMDENNLFDAKKFKGVPSKFKAFVKAITLSGNNNLQYSYFQLLYSIS